MLASLVALDTAAVFAASHRLEVERDGLAWFGSCEAIDHSALAGLVGTGAQAGLAALLSTASPETAARLGALANVLVTRSPDGPDEFALAVTWPARRVVPAARFVYGGPR
jgi:hypothetical protein